MDNTPIERRIEYVGIPATPLNSKVKHIGPDRVRWRRSFYPRRWGGIERDPFIGLERACSMRVTARRARRMHTAAQETQACVHLRSFELI